MTWLIKKLAAIALGGMFAMSAVSFADFLTCNSSPSAGVEDTRKVQPRRQSGR